MKCNVGGMDRTLRIIIGVALIVLALMVPMSLIWQLLLFAIAAVALITATIKFCPANALFGLNSCAAADKEPNG